MTEENKEVLSEDLSKDEETALNLALKEAFEEADRKAKEEDANEPPAAKADPDQPKTEESEKQPLEAEQKSSEVEGDEQAATTKSKPEEDEASKDVPSNWSAEEKAEFSKLPKEAQALVTNKFKNLEADYTRKSQELAEVRKAVEPIVQQIAPFEQYLRQRGANPSEIVGRVLALQASFDQDPAGTIKRLAQSRNIDLVDLALGSDSKEQPQQLSQDEIVQQAEERAYQRYMQGQMQQRQQHTAQIVSEEINNTEKYPLLNEVQEDVLIEARALAQHNPNQDPREVIRLAYERAVRANPKTYKKLLDGEVKSAVEKEAERLKSEADRARKAGKPVTTKGSTSDRPVSGKKASRDDIISSVLDDAGF